MSVARVNINTPEGEIRISGLKETLYWWADDVAFAIDEAIHAIQEQHGSDPQYVDIVMPALTALQTQMCLIQNSTESEVLRQ